MEIVDRTDTDKVGFSVPFDPNTGTAHANCTADQRLDFHTLANLDADLRLDLSRILDVLELVHAESLS